MTNARELTDHLADLLSREHGAMAEFLVALARFDRQRSWMELGYASLFDFLHRELGLSRGAAHYRKVAAQLVAEYPDVLDALAGGRLCITSVVELAKVLTPDNQADVLPRFFHRSKREAQEVAAELRPMAAPPRRDVVTPARASPCRLPPSSAVAAAPVALFPAVPPATTVDVGHEVNRLNSVTDGAVAAAFSLAPCGTAHEKALLTAPAKERDSVEPLNATHSRLHVTVSRSVLEKLEKARAALSHARPNATKGELLEAALDALLAADAKRKGLTARPRKNPRATNDARHVPAAVRRAVWKRSGGRCEFPLEGGGVCGSTWRLQLDHLEPVALGGKATVETVRVACEFHNVRAARLVFGDACMDRYTSIAAPGEAGP